MWVFTNTGFVSIVQDWNDDSKVFVRGRRKKDVDSFVDGVIDPLNSQVVHTPEHDYHYRVGISKDELKVALSRQVDNIDYFNFKRSMRDDDLHRFASEMWLAGIRNLDEKYAYTYQDASDFWK